MVATFGATSTFAVVFESTSSTEWPGATSVSMNRSPRFSKTARSVMSMSTHDLPVSGSVQRGMNLLSPFLLQCSMTTMRRLTPATRSIAPPIPLTSLPGIIQFARSPCSSTSIAPRIARSM